MKNGTVFSIEEFSVYDGPGIRTTVFLKGCPLRCDWCHNPEGQSAMPEIVKSPNGCVGCGNCIRHADRDGDRIRYTAESAAACPKGLLRVCGEEMSADDLCEKLLKNASLLDGVTFSGGEPLFQPDFLVACLTLLSGKLPTAIQTSGYCPDERKFAEILSLVDYVLYDLKIFDEATHKKHTGLSNRVIFRNFETLIESGKEFVVRIPFIPSVTDTRENLSGLCGLMCRLGVTYAEILPYNKMAGGKYKSVGREYRPAFDEKKEVDLSPENLEIFAKNHISFKIL